MPAAPAATAAAAPPYVAYPYTYGYPVVPTAAPGQAPAAYAPPAAAPLNAAAATNAPPPANATTGQQQAQSGNAVAPLQ